MRWKIKKIFEEDVGPSDLKRVQAIPKDGEPKFSGSDRSLESPLPSLNLIKTIMVVDLWHSIATDKKPEAEQVGGSLGDVSNFLL